MQGVQIGCGPPLTWLDKFEPCHHPMSIYRISCSWFRGLVGDNCKNESAEKCEAEAGGQHDVARRKGGFEFGFGFVGHGFGVGGWNKRMCVGEPHPSVGFLLLFISLLWLA